MKIYEHRNGPHYRETLFSILKSERSHIGAVHTLFLGVLLDAAVLPLHAV